MEKYGLIQQENPSATAGSPVPIHVLTAQGFADWQQQASAPHQNWVRSVGFTGQEGEHVLLPGESGGIEAVLVGRGDAAPDLWTLARVQGLLPAGHYGLGAGAWAGRPAPVDALIGWALSAYRFDRYRDMPTRGACLVAGKHVSDADWKTVETVVDGLCLTRTLINTPAGDMGPSALAREAQLLAEQAGATCKVTTGENLLADNFPAIHAVGRAADDAPRLIDLAWGPSDAPKVTLVGKGVCFDSGGLNLKSAAGMKFMKKDMGGAAAVLGLASMVMAAGLPIRLRVLIPAVENAVSGNAYRPMDVVPTRAGLTVEIGNTDAEGRVVLADALALASEEKPDLILDFATLTGAARVALGLELPALFSNDDDLADDLLRGSQDRQDPLWRMPLWDGYEPSLKGDVADITNAPGGGFGGAITAALFLRRFVDPTIPWAHVDTYGWNAETRPGRPKGGEALGVRAGFAMLQQRYGG